MPRQLDPAIADTLKAHGFDRNAVWDCHGTWVVYHRVLEQIAAKTGIAYDTPQVLVAEKSAAAILVKGSLGDRSEWSIGEAVINQNYTVKGKQPAYPFAMAEKRAKDRVILKLIGLQGLVYSEDEADEFKPGDQPASTDTPNDDVMAMQRDLLSAVGVRDTTEAQRMSDADATVALGRLRDQWKNICTHDAFKALSKAQGGMVSDLKDKLKEALERKVPA